ncbi:MAG: 1-deoxy-D-xylulose-5-phosphate reductoisomerase [Syntrophobacteraceae bacterium]|nr:1-deoxy-D-xylulose-5-phosphate reductoisomerase [Syntrophobacteraceae bacterium]
MTRKKISIIGSTGSIGRSTLDVVRSFADRFEVVALGAGSNAKLLSEQIAEFSPRIVSVLDAPTAGALEALLDRKSARLPEILYGSEGYCAVAAIPEADMLVSAMVGSAGLLPTLAAIQAGKDIALANKETLVAAGELVTEAVAACKVKLLPVDSEHSAIFQALQGNHREALGRILLTASGGPFIKATREELETVSPEAALRHPNWSMGPKISIDSATLMNKGLEVIEAHWLFGVPVDQISVHIHPESVVHSMVEYVDGSVIAQLGIPDMRIPIAYAMSYPERLKTSYPSLDLFRIRELHFYPPDEEKFPCLRLAFEACRKGATTPAVLNAANETAVHAFLEKRIAFYDIPGVIRQVMDSHTPCLKPDLQAILTADAWARDEASKIIDAHTLKK